MAAEGGWAGPGGTFGVGPGLGMLAGGSSTGLRVSWWAGDVDAA